MSEQMLKNARECIINDINDKVDIAVIGLSGGADSTLVATLCTAAVGQANVYGLGMPYNMIDMTTFNDRSKKLADALGINYEVSAIGTAVDAVKDQFNVELSTLNQGNLRSRMRMVTLYTYACKIAEANPDKRVRVMGTGNLSEDFIGYDTKGGDALADIFPIGQLLKQDVYNMLDMYVADDILTDDLIDRVPSAGLWDGQTDEDELGISYNAMAPAIKFLQKHYMNFQGITELENFIEVMDNASQDNYDFDDEQKRILWFVWDRHIKNKHKHEGPYVTDLNGVK